MRSLDMFTENTTFCLALCIFVLFYIFEIFLFSSTCPTVGADAREPVSTIDARGSVEAGTTLALILVFGAVDSF